MWHGAGQFSKSWETTPDGREGFQNIFLRRRFATYLIDQPRRGDAGRSTVEATIKPRLTSTLVQPVPRRCLAQLLRRRPVRPQPGDAEPVFPVNDAEYRPFDMNVVSDGVSALFDRIGPGILFTHSQAAVPAG